MRNKIIIFFAPFAGCLACGSVLAATVDDYVARYVDCGMDRFTRRH